MFERILYVFCVSVHKGVIHGAKKEKQGDKVKWGLIANTLVP